MVKFGLEAFRILYSCFGVQEFHPAQPEHQASGIPGLNLCMLHLSRALGFAYTGALMWPVVEGAGEEEEGLFKANSQGLFKANSQGLFKAKSDE